ncbi:hypothetical protein [Dyadobacter frigoris]|uniref:Uncharacterized protein n=1 Tax=Dyadobacter frigoris TaxID=2576211 RepID=A0A4U6CLY7_9BACT|nr:hypothetical protein [Dyadobacter frigoris]TKT85322.1 hypothetical protein FDK13_33985 [Dyadobacter frigoris]GLU56947.1 hypothetical protein Dfri01_64080 [Dyadobacter frigoris]
MKKTYMNPFQIKGWIKIMASAALLALGGAVQAQEGSLGNTTIFGGAQMTFFGNSNFLTPTGGTQPGVILTERATATISYLNYFGNNLTATGVTDASYVDGYVRKYGTGLFVFPVGDNGNAGQFAASSDGTSGAYFHTDATTAVTSNLFTGTNYPVLPAGGPFPTTSVAAGVGTVSKIEYWDIDGATATPITLTWDGGSNITTLTANALGKLTIVGWNPGTSKWEAIASAVDVTSVLGGASDILLGGSITSTASVIPNTYTAYTLAAVGTIDLTPTLPRPLVTSFLGGQTSEGVLRLTNLTPNPTTGTVVVFLELGSGFEMTVDPAAVISGGLAVTNAQWTITDFGGGSFEFDSKPGVVIAANSFVNLGYKLKATGPVTTTGIITATIDTKTGSANVATGDSNDNNNIVVKVLGIVL